MSDKQADYVSDSSGLVKWMLLYTAIFLALSIAGVFVRFEIMRWLYVAAFASGLIHFVRLRLQGGRG